jgi:hypothetical protein
MNGYYISRLNPSEKIPVEPRDEINLSNMYLIELVLPKCKKVHCYRNDLTSLIVPEGCEYIGCWSNNLTSLTIPMTCKGIVCSDNYLTKLILPKEAEYILCNSNLLPKIIIDLFESGNSLKIELANNLQKTKTKMKIFNFGYAGYESPRYVTFYHNHNDDSQFNIDCTNVLKTLTKEALFKKQQYDNRMAAKFDDLDIRRCPSKYCLSSFFDKKRIVEEMTKLGYTEPNEVFFMPFLDVVQPHTDYDNNDSITNTELLNLLGEDLFNEIISYNDDINIKYEEYCHKKYDSKSAETVSISKDILDIPNGIVIKSNKFFFIEDNSHIVFCPALDILEYGNTYSEAEELFNSSLKDFCEILYRVSSSEQNEEMTNLGYTLVDNVYVNSNCTYKDSRFEHFTYKYNAGIHN